MGFFMILSLLSMPSIPGIDNKLAYRHLMAKKEIRINTPEDKGKALLDSIRSIVLLVDFNDNHSVYSQSNFENLLFSEGWGSMRNYYKEVSYERFEIVGHCRGWYRMPLLYTEYVRGNYGFNGDEPNVFTLVRDAVEAADPSVDFSNYDLDGDGMVDALFVVHSGPGAEATGDTNDIWSHKSSFSSNGLSPVQTDDNVYVDVYSMEPERFPDNSFVTIGVFCHEFCHVLGAPDIYDIDRGSAVIGKFGLMDAGSWNGNPPGSSPSHPCIWVKYLLGWVDPFGLEKGACDSIYQAEIPAIEETPIAYRMLKNPEGNDWEWGTGGIGEYFLIENRERMGYDSALPGNGLLILHCNENELDNTDRDNRLVCVMQADSDDATSTTGEASDLWKNRVIGFDEISIPSSILWNGTPTGVSVSNISPAGELVRADLKIGLVMLDEVYSYPNPFIKGESGEYLTIRYVPSDIKKAYGKHPNFTVSIYSITGNLVRRLTRPGEIYPEARFALWDGIDDAGNPVPSGIYFYIIEIENERNKGKLTFVR